MNRPIQTIPFWMLLLAPMLAFAQGGSYNPGIPMRQEVTHSPLMWWWVAALAVAIVAFVGYTLKISRHGRTPNRPSTP